jgi:hypothetical protein
MKNKVKNYIINTYKIIPRYSGKTKLMYCNGLGWEASVHIDSLFPDKGFIIIY